MRPGEGLFIRTRKWTGWGGSRHPAVIDVSINIGLGRTQSHPLRGRFRISHMYRGRHGIRETHRPDWTSLDPAGLLTARDGSTSELSTPALQRVRGTSAVRADRSPTAQLRDSYLASFEACFRSEHFDALPWTFAPVSRPT